MRRVCTFRCRNGTRQARRTKIEKATFRANLNFALHVRRLCRHVPHHAHNTAQDAPCQVHGGDPCYYAATACGSYRSRKNIFEYINEFDFVGLIFLSGKIPDFTPNHRCFCCHAPFFGTFSASIVGICKLFSPETAKKAFSILIFCGIMIFV